MSFFVCSSRCEAAVFVRPAPCWQPCLCADRSVAESSHLTVVLLPGTEGSRQRPHRSPLRLPASVRLRGQRLHSRLPKFAQLLQQRGRPGLRLSQRLGPSLQKTGRHVRWERWLRQRSHTWKDEKMEAFPADGHGQLLIFPTRTAELWL